MDCLEDFYIVGENYFFLDLVKKTVRSTVCEPFDISSGKSFYIRSKVERFDFKTLLTTIFKSFKIGVKVVQQECYGGFFHMTILPKGDIDRVKLQIMFGWQ